MSSGQDLILRHPTGSCCLPRRADARLLQARTVAWCGTNRLLTDNSRAEETQAGLNPGLFSVLVYPQADEDAAQLLSDFMAWWFLLDDGLESMADLPPATAGNSRQFEIYSTALADQQPSGTTNVSISVASEIGHRLQLLSLDSWHRRFCAAMSDWLFKGITEELVCRQNEQHKAGIGIDQYLNIRHFSSGAIPTLYLGELAKTGRPCLRPASTLVEAFLEQAARIIFLANDTFSFTKEQNEPAPFNLILIIQQRLGGDLGRALAECADHYNRYNRAVECYLQIRDEL
ncbi:MAG: hypothetical protein ABFS18_10970 [Thermodesulfobacteriota bacterium]